MKLILSTLFSLICWRLFAQKDSEQDINEALKNPLEASPETIELFKSLLPANCTLFGLTTGEEIRSEIDLR